MVLAIVEGKDKLSFEGKKLSLWFYGTMAFAVYNLLVFKGQKMIGDKGAILGSILMALIPIASVIVSWLYKGVKPPKFTLFCIFAALLGVWIVITKGDYKKKAIKDNAFALRLEERKLNRSEQDKYIETIKNGNSTFIKLTDEEKNKWKSEAESLYKDYETKIGKDLLDKVRKAGGY